MSCSHCGSATSAQDGFCRACGTVQSPAPAAVQPALARRDLTLPVGLIGFLVGAIVGFMLRPSALLVGQLPFSVVISRGAYLSGVEELLRPVAEASFNQVLAAAIVGAVACAIAGLLIKSVSARAS